MEKVKQAQSSLVVFDHQVNCGSVSQHEAHTLPGIEFFVRIHFFLDLMSEIVGAECALCNNLILTTWKNRFPELWAYIVVLFLFVRAQLSSNYHLFIVFNLVLLEGWSYTAIERADDIINTDFAHKLEIVQETRLYFRENDVSTFVIKAYIYSLLVHIRVIVFNCSKTRNKKLLSPAVCIIGSLFWPQPSVKITWDVFIW